VSEALKILCEKLESFKEKDDEFVLYILNNRYNDKGENKFNQNFYNYLFDQEYYTELYQALHQRSLDDLSSSEILFLLNSIYHMGRINEFLNKAKEVNEYLLTSKYYVAFEHFTNAFDEKLKHKDFFKIGKLLFLVEMNDVVKINKLIKDQLPLLFAGKVEETFLKATYNLLEQVKTDDYKHHKNKVLYKFFLKNQSLNELINKDVMDLLLLAENKEDFFLIYETSENLVFKNTLLLFLKETYEINTKEILPIFKLLKKDWDGKITISKLSIEKNKKESVLAKEDLIVRKKLNHPIYQETYKPDESEKNVLKKLMIENENDNLSSDVVIGYIKLKYYKVAEYLVDKLEENSNKYYLNSVVMLGQCNYSEVISFCNMALTKFDIKEEDSVPFEYLKAESFECLGDEMSAHKCLERIASINPKFRNTEEKLLK
jgi:hypothetical protein